MSDDTEQKPRVTVINNAPRRHVVGGHFALNVGSNEVDADLWESAKRIPVIKHYLKNGDLEEKLGEVGKLKPEDAIAVIKQTYDLSMLDRWAVDEKRRPVRDVIETRKTELVEELRKATEKRKGG